MRILHLEDNSVNGQQVADTLAAAGMPAEITRVDSRAGFEAALREGVAQGGLDLILARYWLPGLPGLEALTLARTRCPEVPFIFVAVALDQERLVGVLRQGPTHYLPKAHLPP